MVEILEHQGSCGGSCLLWSPVIDGRVIFILVLILLHSATCKSSSVSNCKNSLVHARFIEPLKVKICKYISIYRTTSESSNPQWMVGLAQRRSNPPNLLSAIHVSSADGLQWDDVRRVDRHIYIWVFDRSPLTSTEAQLKYIFEDQRGMIWIPSIPEVQTTRK